MRRVRVELPPGVARALLHALVAFARASGAALAVVALLAVAATAVGLVVVAHGIAVLLLVLLANVVHELGHVIAYRLAAPARRAQLECDGFRAALHRDRLARRADRAVTAAGPLAPLLLVPALLPFASTSPAEAVAAGVIAAAHALGLVLPTADRRAWREAVAGNAPRPSPRGTDSPTLGA
jgi:hypothetical protein